MESLLLPYSQFLTAFAKSRGLIFRPQAKKTSGTTAMQTTRHSTKLTRLSLSLHVLPVSTVLIAPTFSNVCNFGSERDRQNSQYHVDRSLEDLAILFWASLANLRPFQSCGSFKKLERITLSRLLVSYHDGLRVLCFNSLPWSIFPGPFENLLHMLHFFPKRSPVGLLVSENISSPIHSLLKNRGRLHYISLQSRKQLSWYRFSQQERSYFSKKKLHLIQTAIWNTNGSKSYFPYLRTRGQSSRTKLFGDQLAIAS